MTEPNKIKTALISQSYSFDILYTQRQNLPVVEKSYVLNDLTESNANVELMDSPSRQNPKGTKADP